MTPMEYILRNIGFTLLIGGYVALLGVAVLALGAVCLKKVQAWRVQS